MKYTIKANLMPKNELNIEIHYLNGDYYTDLWTTNDWFWDKETKEYWYFYDYLNQKETWSREELLNLGVLVEDEE